MANVIVPKVLIPATTDAVSDPVPFPVTQDDVPALLAATGLSGVETVVVNVSVDGGVTWQPSTSLGSSIELTESNNAIPVNSPIMLGVSKGVTSAAVGVSIMTRQKQAAFFDPSVFSINSFLLLESDGFLLLENDGRIVLE